MPTISVDVLSLRLCGETLLKNITASKDRTSVRRVFMSPGWLNAN
ncbi:MAG: hypothetical protein QF732_03115 [Nitrospinaceae bacterium]|nr:hypothetical protein [Nitrospinaceae bacterium]